MQKAFASGGESQCSDKQIMSGANERVRISSSSVLFLTDCMFREITVRLVILSVLAACLGEKPSGLASRLGSVVGV